MFALVCILISSDIAFLGEKDQLAGEAQERRDEVARLKTEIEKLKEDHAAQITQVMEATSTEIANAKEGFADTEKRLRAEINAPQAREWEPQGHQP